MKRNVFVVAYTAISAVWFLAFVINWNVLGHFNLRSFMLSFTKDDTQAVTLYRKAAEQGYANAQNDLGVMYANGEGVPQDDTQAVSWYRKAADQGYALAQFNLGVMYDNGRGVPLDDAEAVAWYRKAAEQGYANAQNDLGVMYANGEGVPQGNAGP